jgi:hypothetical protein
MVVGAAGVRLGWEGGRDGRRDISSLFGHPPNLIFGNAGQLWSFKISRYVINDTGIIPEGKHQRGSTEQLS